MKLLGAFCAGFGCYLIVAGIEMPAWAKYSCIVVAGLLGMCLIRGNENNIISYGTGFLGAFMMMHGLGMYLKGFPPLDMNNIKEQKLTTKFIGYLAGIVIFTIIGGRVQLKKISESDGDFMSSNYA